MFSACTGDDASPSDALEEVPLWLTSTAEPYPFTIPIPPVEVTQIDGSYVRHVSARAAGSGSVLCRRCAPYRIETGTTILTFERGRFLVAHEAPGQPTSSQFHSRGHFTVEGDTLVLFNDANCPKTRGVYEWQLTAGRLTFEMVKDPCPYSQLRERFLTATTWGAQT